MAEPLTSWYLKYEFLCLIFEEENLGHSIQKIFSKFGHSPEFRVFKENLGKFRDFSSEFEPWKCLLKIFFSLWPKFFHL